jgi:hypothetical protein
MYRQLFSSNRAMKPGPKAPSLDLIAAVVAMKQRNPSWGCPRIAQQITLTFGIRIDKDVLRRILPTRTSPNQSPRQYLQRASQARGAGRAAASAESIRSGASAGLSVAAALSWAVSHAGRVMKPPRRSHAATHECASHKTCPADERR